MKNSNDFIEVKGTIFFDKNIFLLTENGYIKPKDLKNGDVIIGYKSEEIKINTNLIITDNISSHGFEIGEEVKFTTYLPQDQLYVCKNKSGDICYITRNEFKYSE